jgi:hypothetical protein
MSLKPLHYLAAALLIIGTGCATRYYKPGCATRCYTFGPIYSSSEDSLFKASDFVYFHLEDFEDGCLDTPGVVVDSGNVFPHDSTLEIDSVDFDDKVLDGLGLKGASFGAGASYGRGRDSSFTFTFCREKLKPRKLPTHVGIVFTDAGSQKEETIKLEAFASDGTSLGAVKKVVKNKHVASGSSANDEFVGISNFRGIQKIEISCTWDDWELDHLQYGYKASLDCSKRK